MQFLKQLILPIAAVVSLGLFQLKRYAVCRPLETACRAEDVFKVVSTFFATIAYLGKNL